MRKKKIRIGILTHNYPSNHSDRKDAGIFIHDFANELAKYSKVFIFCPDFGGKKERYKKVPVTWFNWGKDNTKFGNWKLYNPIYIYKFFKMLFIGQKEATNFARINKLDYCVACWTIPSAIFALIIKIKLKIPYAVWSLGSDVNKYSKIPILSQLIHLSLRLANKRYANSHLLCDKVENISGKRCKFMPAITNFKLAKISKVSLNKKEVNLLFVGRLEKVKGADTLIDAIKLAKNQKTISLNILGDGSERNALEKKAPKRIVKFRGWADESMVGGYMKESDCLVIPSRNESLPLVIIEASKLKLPVIATKVGDCERIIKKYKIGISVEKENPQALAKAIDYVSNNKLNKKKMLFKKLTTDFSQEKTVKNFLKEIL